MDTHKLFLEFDKEIRLSDSKTDDLRKNRDAIRKKIRDYFTDKKWGTLRFYSQGSFPLKTNLNPISGRDYDLDDGVYFVCPLSERLGASAYHDRIKNAVADHAKEVKDKSTCVRVIYADGHHVDLPCYWLENENDTPQLAHKQDGFIESDPKAFKNWVEGKISDAGNNEQLRKIIRYLKAWKDHREYKNSSLRLLSGFILTILACKYFSKNERDDISLKETINAIKNELSLSFFCCAPTTPGGENLLEKYLDSKHTVIGEFEKFFDNAQNAIHSDCENEALKYWHNVFGDRFLPSDGNGDNKGKGAAALVAPSAGSSQSAPASTIPAQKPFGGSETPHQKITRQNAKYSPEDFQKVKDRFPYLEYYPDEKCVKGKFFVSGRYEKNENGLWDIVLVPESHSEDSFAKEYSILINLNNGVKVYETSGEIIRTADKYGKPKVDLHLFADDSCCLSFSLSCCPWEMSLSEFIIYGVYPYFSWQAYYAKFGKCPPCGEYPHNWEDAKKEFLDDIKNRRADDPIFAKAAQSLNLTAEAKNKAVSNSP
jgi:hypothetical protein